MTRVRCKRPNPEARLRLFCFPFAGGIGVYNSWYDELPPETRCATELCSIHLPGHEGNLQETLFSRLSPLLNLLVPAVASYRNIPFAFFGHSMGALVSFELARQLRRQGLPSPVHMIVSGYRAPQLEDPHPAIHQLPDLEFQAQLRRLGGTPDGVLEDSELMELLLPVLRADFAVCENYTYLTEQPLDCSITAYGGDKDAKVTRAELSAWRAQTRNSFSLRMFPGGHFFWQNNQPLLLQVLSQELRGNP